MARCRARDAVVPLGVVCCFLPADEGKHVQFSLLGARAEVGVRPPRFEGYTSNIYFFLTKRTEKMRDYHYGDGEESRVFCKDNRLK